MNNHRASCLEPDDTSDRRKRLGQFFSGTPLSKLLAALADSDSASSIIDPMCGNGDMLDACGTSSSKVLVGVEIDRTAHRHAKDRLCDTNAIVLGNCFRRETLSKLPQLQYDLVITNPPYIRYQALSQNNSGVTALPTAQEIRESLSEMVDVFPSLDETDRALFKKIVRGYSGLSDAAVPSWILCAMLTKVGGKLAMVVPESWLSRNYAKIVQYLLLRWFKIRCIVEDADVAWFKDALVKTTLLIAERIPRRDSAFSWEKEEFSFISLGSDLISEESVVGYLYPSDPKPEKRFSDWVFSDSVLQVPRNRKQRISHKKILFSQKAENLRRSCRQAKWISELEPTLNIKTSETGCEIPNVIANLLGRTKLSFHSLEELGLNIGQGLRTGANQFFYVDVISESKKAICVHPHSIFGVCSIDVPRELLKPVLRKQAELRQGFQIEQSTLPGRVFALQKYALPEDIAIAGILPGTLQILPPAIADFVRIAAKTNVGSANEPEYIPNLSAVRTNVRPKMQRFWYMLPDFAPRHYSELLIPRINYGSPKTFFNPDKILVDANFSTLWPKLNLTISLNALHAMLNSAWCNVAMESLGTVMGGGALKLEATQLRRVPIPRFSAKNIHKLDELGKELLQSSVSGRVIQIIDQVIVSEIYSDGIIGDKVSSITRVRADLLEKRAKGK